MAPFAWAKGGGVRRSVILGVVGERGELAPSFLRAPAPEPNEINALRLSRTAHPEALKTTPILSPPTSKGRGVGRRPDGLVAVIEREALVGVFGDDPRDWIRSGSLKHRDKGLAVEVLANATGVG